MRDGDSLLGARKPLLLDAGPLLTYLALRYLDSTAKSKIRRDAVFQEIRKEGSSFAEPEQERLRLLMKSGPVLTTSHVIAEVMKLRANSRLAQEAESFRKYSLTLFAGSEIRETSCSVAELNREQDFRNLVCRLGLTDAAVIWIAAQRRCLVLTDDYPLFQTYSAGAKYEIRLLDEYLIQT